MRVSSMYFWEEVADQIRHIGIGKEPDLSGSG